VLRKTVYMRIGINCFELNDKMGGLRQYCQRLIRELLDNDHENRYVIFYSPYNRHEIAQIGGERLWESAIQVNGYGELFAQLGSIDLYFCPFGVLWPRPVPIASVVNLADIQEVYYPCFFSQEDLDSRKRHRQNSTRSAECVLTSSEFSKRSIIEHHDIPSDKIFVAYYCSDKSLFKSPPKDLLNNINLPDRFILFPANYWPHKNHDVLLRALQYLRNAEGIVIPCVLTGHETDNSYPVKDKISEYELGCQITVLGYVTNEEIHALYHRADMLCFPSLFEGFGMPLVDAMAAGLPITCSNSTSIPEVVGDAALLFDPNNYVEVAESIQKLWYDDVLREKLVEAGRARVKMFTEANMAKIHLQAFKAAVETSDVANYNIFLRLSNKLPQSSFIQYQMINLKKNLLALKSSLAWRITVLLRKLLDSLGKL
jgi:glycosyltransferase involved in cell wall biosynthesis